MCSFRHYQEHPEQFHEKSLIYFLTILTIVCYARLYFLIYWEDHIEEANERKRAKYQELVANAAGTQVGI